MSKPTPLSRIPPRLWPALPDAARHRLACLMARGLCPLLRAGPVEDGGNVEHGTR